MEEFQIRMLNEFKELGDRKDKLSTALNSDGFEEKVSKKQFDLMHNQLEGMTIYFNALKERISLMGLL